MENHAHQMIYSKDYTPSDFLIDAIFLHVDLHEDVTHVKSLLHVKQNSLKNIISSKTLVLNGEEMKLKNIRLDGVELKENQYQVNDTQLTIFNVPEKFTLETEVEIKPQDNKRLAGLYKTGETFCTQCESHGFRRITYYLDRPDVLARFTTTISADKDRYPVLLSNGNLVDSKLLNDNRHWVKWEDPTLKPAYLFALVAGNLDVLEDTFVTQSGRNVKLAIYVEPGKKDQSTFAMQSLKEAMRWDEENYGREYELDIYMIVGVSDFNFGAMENKGLNIFNDKYILAKPETATDEDFINIESVIAHEYFHNWSGNRVTVRDWFQITLKEGLTVFRDQQFTSDMTSKVVERIQEVKSIIGPQFLQDAGPMAHPILPDAYIEVNNFYTVTVYEKGSEVIRMIHTLLGAKIFRKAMDLYFSRNDGHPVTTEEFIKAMEDASGISLIQFRRWYKQAGTPIITVKENYNAQEKTYTLTVTQTCAPTPDQPHKEPFHIPFALGLLDEKGHDLPLQLEGESAASSDKTRVLNVTLPSQTFSFVNVPCKPVPSLLRNFSAPVKLEINYSETDLLFLMAHDSDAFNRWYVSQKLATQILLSLIQSHQQKQTLKSPAAFLEALSAVFHNKTLDDAFIAEMLVLPTEAYLLDQMETADIDAVHFVRTWLKKQIALTLKAGFKSYYDQHSQVVPYTFTAKTIGQRSLKNLVLAYLSQLEEPDIYKLCLTQFEQSNNMTDTIGALSALIHIDCPERTTALSAFYTRWKHDPLVIHKWFTLQAQSSLPNTLEVVKSLTEHPDFDIKNPNRVRALLGAFCVGNLSQFHNISGEGYTFLTDYVLKIDRFNPQLAARILDPLIHWKKFDGKRKQLMKAQLERILGTKPLSQDVYEIVSKSLKHGPL